MNQHSPSKCNLKDGKGGICHIGFPWRLLNTFDVSFATFIQTEDYVCFFQRAHVDCHEGKHPVIKKPGNIPNLNSSHLKYELS